jgi:hypothetical protein
VSLPHAAAKLSAVRRKRSLLLLITVETVEVAQ